MHISKEKGWDQEPPYARNVTFLMNDDSRSIGILYEEGRGECDNSVCDTLF